MTCCASSQPVCTAHLDGLLRQAMFIAANLVALSLARQDSVVFNIASFDELFRWAAEVGRQTVFMYVYKVS